MNEQGMSQNGWIESPEHNADGNSLTALDVKITDLFRFMKNKVQTQAAPPAKTAANE